MKKDSEKFSKFAPKKDGVAKKFAKDGELNLAELPVGASATILKILPHSRGGKKFSDVGLVAGTELLMQAHAPFGGLLRVKVMETSMAIHRDDAKNIIVKENDSDEEKV